MDLVVYSSHYQHSQRLVSLHLSELVLLQFSSGALHTLPKANLLSAFLGSFISGRPVFAMHSRLICASSCLKPAPYFASSVIKGEKIHRTAITDCGLITEEREHTFFLFLPFPEPFWRSIAKHRQSVCKINRIDDSSSLAVSCFVATRLCSTHLLHQNVSECVLFC